MVRAERYHRGVADCSFVASVLAVFAIVLSAELLVAQVDVAKIAPGDWLAAFGLEDQSFVVVESDHFSLATDVDHFDTGFWIEQLESTYASVKQFSTTLKLPFVTPISKLHVIVFARPDDLRQLADRTNVAIQQSNGLYIVERNVSVFVDAASHPLLNRASEQIKALRAELDQFDDVKTSPMDLHKRDEDRRKVSQLQQRYDRLRLRFNRVVLRHEAAHQIFYNAVIHDDNRFDQLWLREGLACLFETTPIQHVNLPVNRSRLDDLPWLRGLRPSRAGDDSTDRDAPLRIAIKGCRDSTIALISDDEFLSAEHADAAQRYAEAWALVYYLSENFPQAFAKYVQHEDTNRSLNQHADICRLCAFETMFGSLDEEFCRRWLKYLAQKRFDRIPAGR